MHRSRIVVGDCLDIIAKLPDASVDSVVTDPPYGLSKQPEIAKVLTKWLAGEDYAHRGGGFMGKGWDSFVPGPAIWREVMRVLKPGGHVLAFFGTRTYDLGTIAMRIAGFEVRDQLAWMYGQGFPKSLDVSKAIDNASRAQRPVLLRAQGAGTSNTDSLGVFAQTYDVTAPATDAAKQWDGWGTALKPAQEPIVLARKPFKGTTAANVRKYGTGGLNIDGCRIEATDPDYAKKGASVVGLSGPQDAVDSRPRTDSTHELGRFPANVILGELAAEMLDEQTGELTSGTIRQGQRIIKYKSAAFGAEKDRLSRGFVGSSGGASRFFYCAKASRSEREAGLQHLPIVTNGRRNTHPTIKPIELMRWLVRLVTPPSGLVLDPFCGSGSTGCAAMLEGFRFLGCELSADYARLARERIKHARRKHSYYAKPKSKRNHVPRKQPENQLALFT